MTFDEFKKTYFSYIGGMLGADVADEVAKSAWQAAYSQGKADIKEPFIKLSAALSQIDYLLGEPNDMETSLYDLDYAEDRVVARARQFIEDAKERERKAYRAGQEDMRERIKSIMHCEVYHYDTNGYLIVSDNFEKAVNALEIKEVE